MGSEGLGLQEPYDVHFVIRMVSTLSQHIFCGFSTQGGDEELGSQEDPEEEEVVYQNHHVHPSVVNHSKPNATQVHVDDTMSR